MRKAVYAFAVLAAVAVVVPWSVIAQTPPEDAALDRIERHYGLFEWGCIDFCGGYEFQLETSPDVAAVDVVVTATISYRLAARHRGSATLWRVVSGNSFPPPMEPVRGGTWTLPSTGGRNATTTLTWFARNLPAEGETHHFFLTFNGGSFIRGQYVAETRKAVVVAEVWSAGR
jgi:hypothetical protein